MRSLCLVGCSFDEGLVVGPISVDEDVLVENSSFGGPTRVLAVTARRIVVSGGSFDDVLEFEYPTAVTSQLASERPLADGDQSGVIEVTPLAITGPLRMVAPDARRLVIALNDDSRPDVTIDDVRSLQQLSLEGKMHDVVGTRVEVQEVISLAALDATRVELLGLATDRLDLGGAVVTNDLIIDAPAVPAESGMQIDRAEGASIGGRFVLRDQVLNNARLFIGGDPERQVARPSVVDLSRTRFLHDQVRLLIDADRIVLESCIFPADADLSLRTGTADACGWVSFRGSRFQPGASIRVEGSLIDLGSVVLRSDAVLRQSRFDDNPEIERRGRLPLVGGHVDDIDGRVDPDQPVAPDAQLRPVTVACVSGTNVSGLIASNVSFAHAEFGDCDYLDQLRGVGLGDFPTAGRCEKSGVASEKRGTRRFWFRHNREVIYDELEWRARYARGPRKKSWSTLLEAARRRRSAIGVPTPSPELPHAGLPGVPRVVVSRDWAKHLSETYRALRKEREDAKDRAGANDFYYGEMEMQRRMLPLGVRRTVTYLYWLLAGYALRPLRAFAWLVIIVVGLSLGLMAHQVNRYDLAGTSRVVEAASYTDSNEYVVDRGLCDEISPRVGHDFDADEVCLRIKGEELDQGIDDQALQALWIGSRSALSFWRAPDDIDLTYWGRVTMTMLHWLGPLQLGLVILSLRSVVKR
jgi:hypothetical protein